jgi:hypothetical protein
MHLQFYSNQHLWRCTGNKSNREKQGITRGTGDACILWSRCSKNCINVMILSKYELFRITANWLNLSPPDNSNRSKGSSVTSTIQLLSTNDECNSRLVFAANMQQEPSREFGRRNDWGHSLFYNVDLREKGIISYCFGFSSEYIMEWHSTIRMFIWISYVLLFKLQCSQMNRPLPQIKVKADDKGIFLSSVTL